MGSLFTMLGEYQNALDFQNRALSIFQEIGDRKGEADVHGRAGYIYFCVGELNKALNHYTRSTAVYRESHNRYLEGTMLANIGDVLSALGNDRDALEKYKAALPLIRSVGDKQWEALTQNSMASAYFNLGESRQALDAFNQALPLFEAVRNQRWEANTLNGIGVVYRQSGEWQKALEHHQKALHLSRAAGDRAGEALTLYDIAYAERARGNLDAARSNIESAIRISETLRTNVASHDMRASFLASTHQQYSLYIDVLMRSHNQQPSAGFDSRAFEASERGRARSLLETLAESHANIRQGVDAELIGRERGLQRQLKAGAERRIQLAEEKASSEELATVERELGDLTMEYQQVQGQIRASSPRYAALMQPAPLALGEIQRKVLDADTVLLEYALGEERSFVWAVTPDSIKSFELPARAEVEKAARRVYELLTARNRRPTVETPQQWLAGVRRAEAEYPEASAALGRMLLGPVAAELGRKRLVIVADGALQYVSFAALPAPDTGAAKPEEAAAARGADFIPLIMEHEVVTLPSASVLALTREEMRERRPAPKAVAVLADPVFDGEDERLTSSKSGRARKRSEEVAAESDTAAPGIAQRALRSFDGLDKGGGIARLIFSQREARAIMASVPAAEGMLALGFRASRATATSPELSQYRIVHFATHGLLNSENPELSGVILSRFDEAGRPQEGFLASYEIYNLNLPAELVVLSACQTALGKDVRGEGLVGLTRGFMYAGARRVVASLWKVDDSATAELMGEFYREMLVKGSRPADALRAAQLHMWRQQRWRSPYFWAAFTLQGEWR
jgi:CHAT domain-containing protein/predicted negative regulator of RcsB-dependent stress response